MKFNLLPNDFFTSLQTLLDNVATKTQIVAVAIITVCLIGAGLMHMFGEGLSAKAKKWILGIVIGGIIVFGAATISQTIKDVSDAF